MHVKGFLMSEGTYELIANIGEMLGGRSGSSVVRIAIIKLAKEYGLDTSKAEDPNWGARRDLLAHDPKALEEARKNAEYARSKIDRKRKATVTPALGKKISRKEEARVKGVGAS